MKGFVTRRHFLATASLAPVAIKTLHASPSHGPGAGAEGLFEGLLAEGYNLILTELDGERLLAIGPEPSISISADSGRTWRQPVPLMQEGKPLNRRPHSILRLKDGRLGMVYSRDELRYSTPGVTWYFSFSKDEGRNWSRGTQMDLTGLRSPDHGISLQHPYGALRQLSSGRLLLPMYWQFNGLHPESRDALAAGIVNGRRISLESHGHRPEMGACYVFYSENLGETWKRSIGSIMVWPLPSENGLGGFAGTYEPVVVELKDSRVLMFVRTKVGRLFQSISSDGGATWSSAVPTELATGDVPCDLGRLPSTGDLLVIWNQNSAAEIRSGYYRSRLSVALSKDEAGTWESFKTVECSAGLDAKVLQIPPPPVQHIRTQPDVGELPSGYAMYHYPRLAFVQGNVVMSYQTDTGLVGDPPRMMWRGRVKIKVVPEGWFYS